MIPSGSPPRPDPVIEPHRVAVAGQAGRGAARLPSPAGRPGPPRASTSRAATERRRTAGNPWRTPGVSPPRAR
jgi:hypothetical protein